MGTGDGLVREGTGGGSLKTSEAMKDTQEDLHLPGQRMEALVPRRSREDWGHQAEAVRSARGSTGVFPHRQALRQGRARQADWP